MSALVPFYIDSEIDWQDHNNERVYKVNASSVQYEKNQTNNYGTSSINFNINTPGDHVLVNRTIELTVPTTIAFTRGNTSTGASLLVANRAAFRSAALDRCISDVAFKLNSCPITVPANYGRNMAEYQIHANENWRNSNQLSAQDQGWNYSDFVGMVNSPLNQYADSESYQLGNSVKRGAHPLTATTGLNNTNGNANATISADLKTCIEVPGLIGYGHEKDLGLANINNISLNMNIDLSAKNLFSIDGNTTSQSQITASASISGTPYVSVKYSLPQQPCDKDMVYHIEEFQSFENTGSSMVNGATADVTSNTISVDQVPKKLVLFVTRGDTERTLFTSDAFLQANQVRISFNNEQSLLASATPQDLYFMSQKNGLQDSLTQFLGTSVQGWQTIPSIGSFIVLEFGSDINTGNLVVGQPGRLNLKADVNVTNQSGVTIASPTLHMLVVYDRDLHISKDGQVTIESSPDLYEQQARGGKLVKVQQLQIHRGAGFFDFLKGVNNWLKKTQVLSRVGKAVSGILPGPYGAIGNAVSSALEHHGYGKVKMAPKKKTVKTAKPRKSYVSSLKNQLRNL